MAGATLAGVVQSRDGGGDVAAACVDGGEAALGQGFIARVSEVAASAKA